MGQSDGATRRNLASRRQRQDAAPAPSVGQITPPPRRRESTRLLIRQEWYPYARVAADECRAGDRCGSEAVAHAVKRRIELAGTVERQRELYRAAVRTGRSARSRSALGRDARSAAPPCAAAALASKQDRRRVIRRLGHRVRARCAREVAKAQPQHDGAAHPMGGAQAPGDPVDQRHERGGDLARRPRARTKGTLRADRAPPPPTLDRPRVPVVGQREQMAARRAAEQCDQRRLAQRAPPRRRS